MASLLAFDTSGERLHAAVSVAGRIWVHEEIGGARASARLVALVFELLGKAAVRLTDLDAVAFGRGPGAFTGLRTACSVAQGLALGVAKPVLAIDTLAVIAEDARNGAPAIETWVAVDARMDQIYAACYRYALGSWHTLAAPMLTDVAALNHIWATHPAKHVAGNAVHAFAGRLHVGATRCSTDAAPRGTALLALAHAAWLRGDAVDAAAAMPIYLRDKVALTVAERSATRTGANPE